MSKDITIVMAEDWQALYADGKQIASGHTLNIFEVLGALGFDMKSVCLKQDWAEDNWWPADLSKIPCDAILHHRSASL